VSKNKELYNLEIHEVISELKSSHDGLSKTEAARRLAEYGPNVLSAKKTPLWRRILEPFASYFVIVIVIAALISLFERQWFEAIVISIIIVVNALIYYFQQFSAGRALKSLMTQDRQKVSIVRDGETITVYSEELVPGDIVHVEEGMKVPADGRLIDASHVQADEAMLTGESLPVHKHAGAISGIRQVYDQENMIFRGTYIRSGAGSMLVTGTANHTQIGAISTLAAGADGGKTPIQQKIDVLTKWILYVVVACSALVFVLALVRGIGLDESLKFALSITVSAVPEGLPVAMTLVLLLSARRMARKHALVKKISAMETMGAITFIATDKTGTITQNKISVAELFGNEVDMSLLHTAIKASLNGDASYTQDPLDQLLHKAADVTLPREWKRVKEYPFNQQLRLSGAVWQNKSGYTLFVKGAPEQILHHSKLTDGQAETELEGFANKGYRTIGFGHKKLATIPPQLSSKLLDSLEFDGFVGLSDQLRPRVSRAIKEARAAGIKVVMLTGDHVKTAGYIAGQVGICDDDSQVSDSNVLATENMTAIRESLKTTRVFGRVLPEHKYSLLKALHGHEITAMTGDGVNDIPALAQADAGLAMGSGTDAAKDASEIVLVDDNFETIISAVRSGRTVLANIRKMVTYLLSTSAGQVLAILAALALNIPLPLTAIMVLWINLVTDGFTVIPLGLSPSEKHHMQQPPRDPQAPLLDWVLLTRTVVLAVTTSVAIIVSFNYFLPKGQSYAQTATFLGLIVMQWANALNMNFEFKSWVHNFFTPNGKLMLAIMGSILLNMAVFMTPIRDSFGLESLDARDALIAIVLPSILAFVVCDLHKAVTGSIVWHRTKSAHQK
jgi:Ca2+-transporting ATPase